MPREHAEGYALSMYLTFLSCELQVFLLAGETIRLRHLLGLLFAVTTPTLSAAGSLSCQ
jgi:hypothetical protein